MTAGNTGSRKWLVVGLVAAGGLLVTCVACGVGFILLGRSTSTTSSTPTAVDLGTLRRAYDTDASGAAVTYGNEWIRTSAYAESPTPGAEPFFVLRETPAPPTTGIPVPIIRCIGAPSSTLPTEGASVSILGRIGDLRAPEGMLGAMPGLRWLEIRECQWTPGP